MQQMTCWLPEPPGLSPATFKLIAVAVPAADKANGIANSRAVKNTPGTPAVVLPNVAITCSQGEDVSGWEPQYEWRTVRYERQAIVARQTSDQPRSRFCTGVLIDHELLNRLSSRRRRER